MTQKPQRTTGHRRLPLLFWLMPLLLAPALFAGNTWCNQFPGALNPNSGICTGTYNICSITYIDFTSPGCVNCPPGCGTVGYSGGVPIGCQYDSYVSCRSYDNNAIGCSARSGCVWTPGSGCADFLGDCSAAPCCDTLVNSCSGNICRLNLGYSCANTWQCVSGNCSISSGVCCTTQGEYGCANNNDCCTSGDICRRTNFTESMRCTTCGAINSYCDYDTDCCSGLLCHADPNDGRTWCGPPNSPPSQPPAPQIAASPSIPPSSTNPAGVLSCASGCPPSPLPIDPDGDNVTMNYSWQKNGVAAGGWSATAGQFDCAAQGCAPNDAVTLLSMACDLYGACNASAPSNQITIMPPVQPPKPAISPSSLYPSGTVTCVSDCAASGYQWKKESTPGSWQNGPASQYLCQANSCVPGDRIYLRTRNCVLSYCNESEWSDPSSVIVFNVVPSSGIDVAYSFAAIMAGIAIIVLGYMATYLFGMPQIRAMLQDELVQVVASGAMLLIIAGVALEVDVYVVSAMKAADSTGSYTNISSAMDAANIVISENINRAGSIFQSAHDTNINIGKQGSKSVYCTFLGVGYSLNNCGQLNAFRGSLTTTGFVASAALSDLYAQQALVSLVRNLAFTFLIPLGLFLRCFKASRRAGGALIAIGFGFYIVYPVAIVATDKMLQASVSLPSKIFPDVQSCDPFETDNAAARGYIQQYASDLSDFGNAESIVYTLVVRVVFSSVFNLIVTLGFIRAFAHIIGSDIDVSSLARIS